MVLSEKEKINELCKILLEVGALLMETGANTFRIRVTVMRIASAFGYHAELLITHRALMLTINNEESDQFFSRLMQTSAHRVNFKIVSGLSRMSWHIAEENWNLDMVRNEIDRLKTVSHYPRIVTLLMVALAGASFCRIFGGESIEMLIAFAATFVGLFVRQEAAKREFNPYLCIFSAAFVSSVISGAAVYLNIGNNPEYAFATSVLYLIPGIPFINSLLDLLDGNIINGVVRGINGLTIALSIALGLLGAILIYNI
ncbi:threonine/serine exporter family protein [Labilibaculum sp.]|uniref:threonine/serine ThrE exporter family protein n=1 Tax=Labilibaculum sp. TaxID=2060723 RepID=UPI002AA955B0|nr:threonine/serine exporter family protein [Labilibaculum sp.]